MGVLLLLAGVVVASTLIPVDVVVRMGLVWIFAGLVFVVLAVLGRKGLLPPNAFPGVRTEETMRSAAAWYAAHRASAAVALVAGIGAAAFGGLVLSCGSALGNQCRLAGGDAQYLALMTFLIFVTAGGVRGHRLARKVNRSLAEHARELGELAQTDEGPSPLEIQWGPSSRPPMTPSQRRRAARLGWKEGEPPDEREEQRQSAGDQLDSVPLETNGQPPPSTNGSSPHHATASEDDRPDTD